MGGGPSLALPSGHSACGVVVKCSNVAPVRLGVTVQRGAQGTRPSLGRGCRPIKEQGNPTWSCHVAL